MSDITLHSTERELDAVRARLQSSRGRQFWRSLDELADTPAFHELLRREFPAGAAEMHDPVTRRTFLKLMGASLALAGLSGCTAAIRPPQEQVAPYARAPYDQQPGIPQFYATATSLDGFGLGVAVKSYDGRPVKIEGNPAHPASLGASDIFTQAELLQLYDPDRPETVLQQGRISTWDQFLAAFGQVMQLQRALQGQGLRILSGSVTSPTLAAQFAELQETFPAAQWVQYDPVGHSNRYEGARLAFGEPVETRYRFDQAQVILALDADFLAAGPGHVRYARDWISGRRVLAETAEVSRLYSVEPIYSSTGIVADHRLRLKAAEVGQAAAYVAAALGVAGAPQASLPAEAAPFLDAAIADLQAAGANALVVVGEYQPAAVHALAHAINAALGAAGTTVEYSDPVMANAAEASDQLAGLRTLVDDLNSGAVELLVVLDSNPVFTAPADLNFAEAMGRARLKVVLNFYNDETAALADWFVPASHSLESWSDVRAFDGSATIIQPLIEPLYGSRNPHELLAAMLGQSGQTDYDLVRAFWQGQSGIADELEFDTFFRRALHAGVVDGSALPARTVSIQGGVSYALPPASEGLELVFRPDPSIYDGRYANNGWLQELPKPVTKLTWDNAALVSPATAIRLLNLPFTVEQLGGEDNIEAQHNLEELTQNNGALVNLSYQGRTLQMPIWIVPGHADDTVTVTLGYGRGELAGRVGANTGFNSYSLRTSDAPWFGGALQVAAAGGSYQLVSTQDHWTLEGRDIVRVGTFEEFRANPRYIAEEVLEHEFGNPEQEFDSVVPGELPPTYDYSQGNQWGMTIDLTACIGCNACVVACQAENNIPIVGKAEVAKGREMHWIRIDRYFAGANYDNPETYVMPMTCQHCEKAPCELVCPVAATVHDSEGINNMVYNRCVGTKYCSNNCPYKVRRFNFLQYQDVNEPSLKLMRNPDVTVRNRGVMEKCTYCIQRISATRIRAKVEGNRPIEDGEVVTACQQACPTQAIVFGDINNPQSQVALIKAQPHNYTVLDVLNTVPRTSYLPRVRNPNQALASEGGEGLH
jgi:MoCo/4Fe-4S cofactor protein with predicted Tat translocation signal